MLGAFGFYWNKTRYLVLQRLNKCFSHAYACICFSGEVGALVLECFVEFICYLWTGKKKLMRSWTEPKLPKFVPAFRPKLWRYEGFFLSSSHKDLNTWPPVGRCYSIKPQLLIFKSLVERALSKEDPQEATIWTVCMECLFGMIASACEKGRSSMEDQLWAWIEWRQLEGNWT